MSGAQFWEYVLSRASMLDELSYYRLLQVEPSATPEEIKRSFHQLAKRLHPDRHARERDPERKHALTILYATVREAFANLSHAERRRAYDQQLAQGRMRLEDASRVSSELDISNQRARRFYELGIERVRGGDISGARQQFQFAQQLEPTSKAIIEALDDVAPKEVPEPTIAAAPPSPGSAPALERRAPRERASNKKPAKPAKRSGAGRGRRAAPRRAKQKTTPGPTRRNESKQAAKGRAALLQGWYREAKERLEMAVAEEPADRALRAIYEVANGHVAGLEGRDSDARQCFVAALELDSECQLAKDALAGDGAGGTE